MKSNFLFHFFGLLFPARCPVCDEVTQRRSRLCEACEKTVERIEEPCPGCGREKSECMCSRSDFKLQLVAPFVYKDDLALAIRRFKFNDELILSEYFAKEMCAAVSKEYLEKKFDFVACVPLTKKKRNKRGYNQSELLAKDCAKLLGTVFENALIKSRDTTDQHELKAKERLKNLKDAFEVNKSVEIKGKTVLLCDDIKTTGATLYECRKALIKAGAKDVCCVCIAVVPEKLIND
ncbi:MAG: ComF family protein [Clostridia bacterium]|nr:ComF family protein [Clostridia bacterium]